MAARKNKGTKDQPWDQKTRDRIQGSMLINRLQNHVFTYEGKADYKKDYMDKSQVTAALGLLKKCLPDLANVELTGADGQPFTIQIVGNLGKHDNDTKQLEAPPVPVQPLELPGGRG